MGADIKTVPLGTSFFARAETSTMAWLGMAGAVINARGTIVLIDPLLTAVESSGKLLCEGDVPLRIPLPLSAADLPRVDAVLYTHADADHFGMMTLASLVQRHSCRFIAPPPVLEAIRKTGVQPARLTLAREGDRVMIGDARIRVTPALHDWQEKDPWKREDCCGYLVQCADGTIWHPGDTRLIDDLYAVKGVDVFLFDVADVTTHLGPSGSAALAASCGARVLVPYHYGTFDLPPGTYATCDPDAAKPFLKESKARWLQLNPGEPLTLPIGP
ncbi:MAG TPA: MBL fold metallo-hydrolase [Spirochaetia bacterium]|nr:MBL fold metallo-hydrolase [Spirochaetia bacterium]